MQIFVRVFFQFTFFVWIVKCLGNETKQKNETHKITFCSLVVFSFIRVNMKLCFSMWYMQWLLAASMTIFCSVVWLGSSVRAAVFPFYYASG